MAQLHLILIILILIKIIQNNPFRRWPVPTWGPPPFVYHYPAWIR